MEVVNNKKRKFSNSPLHKMANVVPTETRNRFNLLGKCTDKEQQNAQTTSTSGSNTQVRSKVDAQKPPPNFIHNVKGYKDMLLTI